MLTIYKYTRIACQKTNEHVVESDTVIFVAFHRDSDLCHNRPLVPNGYMYVFLSFHQFVTIFLDMLQVISDNNLYGKLL